MSSFGPEKGGERKWQKAGQGMVVGGGIGNDTMHETTTIVLSLLFLSPSSLE